MNFKMPLLILCLAFGKAYPQATVGKHKLPAIVVEGTLGDVEPREALRVGRLLTVRDPGSSESLLEG